MMTRLLNTTIQVVADSSGNTVVYNDKDVPIGTGTVRKTGPRSYEVCLICELKALEFTVRRGERAAFNPATCTNLCLCNSFHNLS